MNTCSIPSKETIVNLLDPIKENVMSSNQIPKVKKVTLEDLKRIRGGANPQTRVCAEVQVRTGPLEADVRVG